MARLKEIAAGRSLSQLSLAWVLARPMVSSIVCGVSSVEQLEENLGALELELSARRPGGLRRGVAGAQTDPHHVLREGLRHRLRMTRPVAPRDRVEKPRRKR